MFGLETAIIAVASALQAAAGMGMALLAAPLLALVNPALVPGPMLGAIMALSAVVAWRERAAIDNRVLGTALSGLVVGCILGAAALAALAGLDLTRVFAILILTAVLLSVSGLRVRATRPALLLGGVASGVLGTLVGVQGPPIALVLQHEAPNRLRATLCAYFTAGSLISLLALAASGVFGAAQMRLCVQLLPGVAVGIAIAALVGRRINQRHARMLVLAISALSGLALLLR
ncbi:MAG TPA: sulfite exporter TauE/SafE family protein [Acetobacteraceae bacterium]|nr:sulfite exporter TauE/SafE family protein [Acetobacteraceae bacterium]